MRPSILATAHTLTTPDRNHHADRGRDVGAELDEIAACTGITRHHLRAYFTSPQAIARTLAERDEHALD